MRRSLLISRRNFGKSRAATARPVFKQPWPDFDPDLARESEVEIVVQINGKVRARLVVPAGTDAQGLTSIAMDDDKIQALVAGKTVVKVIAVPDKLINLVVK